MFSVDKKTGKKVDSHLHEPILKGVLEKDERSHRRATRKRAKKTYKLSDEQLDRAYGADSR